jgi:hypothetical protein
VNPQSTPAKPYQDIFIMVFTHAQWDSLQQGKFVVSAAPVGPGELGRNRKYVFAEPPRMINDNAYGWEEVVKIMHSSPLHAFWSTNIRARLVAIELSAEDPRQIF